MTIVYVGPHDAVQLPDGREFKRDEPVKVDKALGESLTARTDFEIVKESK
jgi:hypothetical protein